jgi:phytoene synthase
MTHLDLRLREAYAHCSSIAQSHYENFPVGSLLVPRGLRPHFHALYAFMRMADDFADLPGRSREDRLRLLADWREQLRLGMEGEPPSNPIFIALIDTARKFNIPWASFELLLDAFEFDARGDVSFNTYEDLHWYTRRSAEPVGQLVLMLFGYRDQERFGWSNDICTALQLLNFMQDAGEDLANRRYYFPREDYTKFGIASHEAIATSPRFGDLVLYECDRIEQLLRSGGKLPESVKGRLRLELRAVAAGAQRMLQKIRKQRGHMLEARPKLSAFEQAMVLLSAVILRRHAEF